MTRPPALELDFYPPFEGFPRKGIAFLTQLKKNNRKDWFERRREEFETYVKLPMQSLIVALQPHFNEFAPDYEVNPRKSIFRIYRDVRFSKDKRPYKTHVAAHFVLRGKAKGTEGSGYYLHIEPGEVFMGAGIYMPDGDQLKKIRKHLTNKGEEFANIVENRTIKKIFGELEGEKLQRVPRGFEPTDPMAEWLRLKQFFLGKSFGETICHQPSFVNEIVKSFKGATPLVKFLNDALSGTSKAG